DGRRALRPEDPPLTVDDDVVAERDPEAREEPAEVRQRRGVEEHEHATAAPEVASERRELVGVEVPLRSGEDEHRDALGDVAVAERQALGSVVLVGERAGEPAVAFALAARRALAVPRREGDAPGVAAKDAEDTAGDLVLGRPGRRRPSLVREHGAAVL